MKYESITRLSRQELNAAFEGGNSARIFNALLSAAYHDDDWKWTQDQCLHFLNVPDNQVKRGAIQALAVIAVRFQNLDLATAVPALEALLDNAEVGMEAADTLDQIKAIFRS